MCIKSSGVDLDWIRILWGPWIRIRIRIKEGKNYPEKKKKKLINFIFRSARCSLLIAEGFSCAVAWTSFMEA
jgi:hypothetical protein